MTDSPHSGGLEDSKVSVIGKPRPRIYIPTHNRHDRIVAFTQSILSVSPRYISTGQQTAPPRPCRLSGIVVLKSLKPKTGFEPSPCARP